MFEHVLDKHRTCIYVRFRFSPSTKREIHSFVKTSYNKATNKVENDIIHYEIIYREGFYKIILLHENDDDTTPKVIRDQTINNDLFQYIINRPIYTKTVGFNHPDIFFDNKEYQYLIISEDDYKENKQLLLNNLNTYIRQIIHVKTKRNWNKLKPSSIKIDIKAVRES